MATANSLEEVENKLSNLTSNEIDGRIEGQTSNEIDGKNEGQVNGAEIELPPGYTFSLSLRKDEAYSMNYKRRGYCVIFNQKNFDPSLDKDQRIGTDKDRDSMCELFKELGFEVDVYNDATLNKVKSVIDQYASKDHKNCDCFVMVFMSHIEDQLLCAKDETFKPDLLYNKFTADKCPSLAGKPKLFFIQACRCESLDKEAKMVARSIDQTDNGDSSQSTEYTIPNHADFLICWSTVPDSFAGYKSRRNTTKGSWFIQSLDHVFRDEKFSRDVVTMMTMVNKHMILNFESNCPLSDNTHIQSASLVSTLMRLIYLKPKA